MGKVSVITTPLRYPGGKSKAIPFLSQFLPVMREYREPFVGGGSMLLYVRQRFPNAVCWINDANTDLYCFWKIAQTHNAAFVREVQRVKNGTENGRELFQRLTEQYEQHKASEFERAVRFFVLNRITFSGTVDSGGYSQKAFESRFTDSAIMRLAAVEPVLQGVRITNNDYAEVLQRSSSDTLLFLDPPYFSVKHSRLYGKRGVLHLEFDHKRFAADVQSCAGKWLLTYDDCPLVRQYFSFAHLYEWQLQYGMNNYKQATAAKGNELLLCNYDIPAVQHGANIQTLARQDVLTLF